MKEENKKNKRILKIAGAVIVGLIILAVVVPISE